MQNQPLTLSFAQPFIDVPRNVAIEMFRRFDEVIASLNAIPRDSVLWSSLQQSWLVLRLADWRFHYRVDSGRNKLVVLAAAKASSAA